MNLNPALTLEKAKDGSYSLKHNRNALPVIPGKPNPNIGMGLLTLSDLPQFGEPGWVNPNYDPYHNADGYHRFDATVPGMGMQMSRTYADGAAAYDTYQQRSPNTMYATFSRQFLAENGIDPATATDLQKYASMDYAGRLGQWKNQRPKRKFGMRQVLGLAAQIVGTIYGGPWGAAAGSAFSSGIQGGDLGDMAKAAAISGAATYAGGKFGKLGGGVSTAGSKAGSLSTLGKVAAGVGSAYRTAAPYLRVAGAAASAVNQSGVNLSPDQYNIRQGGSPKITTFEPENKNIAFSAHPTSAYLAAYPNASNAAKPTASPINTASIASIAPIAPINRTTNPAKPYVAPPRVQIASNMPIINYDPRRNYQSPTTMQQALIRPAATRAPSQNARTA